MRDEVCCGGWVELSVVHMFMKSTLQIIISKDSQNSSLQEPQDTNQTKSTDKTVESVDISVSWLTQDKLCGWAGEAKCQKCRNVVAWLSQRSRSTGFHGNSWPPFDYSPRSCWPNQFVSTPLRLKSHPVNNSNWLDWHFARFVRMCHLTSSQLLIWSLRLIYTNNSTASNSIRSVQKWPCKYSWC